MDAARQAKTVIVEEIEKAGLRVRKVLLFGSRARGDSRESSDWDFYVVVDQDMDFSEREGMISRICWRLAQMDIFADVFVQSERVVEERKGNAGYLTHYVLKEGVQI